MAFVWFWTPLSSSLFPLCLDLYCLVLPNNNSGIIIRTTPMLELQTARISTILQLQGRDPDRKLRINLLYTTIGGLGGVKKGFKVV